MGKTYNLAMIGCGDIANEYLEGSAILDSVNIIKIMDVSEQNAKTLSSISGLPYTTSYDEILADPDIYGVIISTPHHLHAPLTIKAAKAGKHILCDKPISTNIEDSIKMIDACHEEKVSLSINYAMRYNACVQKVKNLIDSNILGKIFFISINALFNKPEHYWTKGYNNRVTSDWRSDIDKSGGGILIMNVSHNLDYLLYITGLSINSVMGYSGRYQQYRFPITVEDTAVAVMKLDNGGLMSIQTSSAIKTAVGNISIIAGQNGTIEFDTSSIRMHLNTPTKEYQAGKWLDIEHEPTSPFYLNYHRYLKAWAELQNKGEVPVSGENALELLRIIKQIYG